MAGFLGKAIGGAMVGAAAGMQQQILMDFEAAKENLRRQDRLRERAEDVERADAVYKQGRKDAQADYEQKLGDNRTDATVAHERDLQKTMLNINSREGISAAGRASSEGIAARGVASREEIAAANRVSSRDDDAGLGLSPKDVRTGVVARHTQEQADPSDPTKTIRATDWGAVRLDMLRYGLDENGVRIRTAPENTPPTSGTYMTPDGPARWDAKRRQWFRIEGFDYGK